MTNNGCLEVRVERRDGVVVISPVGEVDLLTVPVLADALADAVAEEKASVSSTWRARTSSHAAR